MAQMSKPILPSKYPSDHAALPITAQVQPSPIQSSTRSFNAISANSNSAGDTGPTLAHIPQRYRFIIKIESDALLGQLGNGKEAVMHVYNTEMRSPSVDVG